MSDGRIRGRAQTRAHKGVTVVGGGGQTGVKVESKAEGGSAETKIEVSNDQNARDTDGRRLFSSSDND